MTDDDSNHDESSINFEELRQPNPPEYLQPHEDPENLRTLYEDLGWTQSDIGEFYDIDRSTVSHHLNKHDIETRDKRAQQRASRRKLHRLKRHRLMRRAGD